MKKSAVKEMSIPDPRRSLLFALALFFALEVAGCGADTATQPMPKGSSSALAVQVSPLNVTLSAGVSLQISASVSNFIHDSTVTWSASVTLANGQQLDSTVGSLSCAGQSATYIAPKLVTGSEFSGENMLVVVIRARSVEDTTKFANCTIYVGGLQSGPSNITINPNAVTLQSGQTQQFTAAIAGSSNCGVRWKLLSGPGIISTAGLYTAASLSDEDSENAVIEAIAAADTLIRATARITIVPPPNPELCFRTVIQAMIISNCSITGCHNPTDMTANLDFTTYTGLMKTVVPGDTAKSLLWYRINTFANPLTPAQIVLIGQWIVAGAQNTQCQEPMSDCDTTGVTYSNFVAPTIKNYCVGCHSGRNVTLCDGYDFSTYFGLYYPARSGLILSVINNGTGEPHMPLNAPQLDSCTISKLTAWINQGAPNN